ncbi:DUF4249 domain-containing protein [Puia sp.]|jgi:hypothetical protein|uniref:DUF4249 domain-containing protein n=1 Tax=Puia sp. TaxID=2045100 RepID=UPI002F3FB06D
MKLRVLYISLLMVTLLVVVIRCKQVYAPPAIKATNNYLVVDGFINTGANAVSSINLNRTRGLNDSTPSGIPELHAKISIVASGGAGYPLTDTAGNGTYTSAPLNLDINQRYSLEITTSDGRKYASDAVSCKRTPPIDSVYWRQPGDLTIYATTHDPANNTRYYRFDYLETWEHDANLQTPWIVVNGRITAADSLTQRSQCWTTVPSGNVLLANSTALSTDVINGFALTTIPYGDTRFNIKYTILVRDYALSEDAYNYWLLVQKTSDNLGTLFDLQPTQLLGNIHCTSNPSEAVIGYLSATSVQEQRIFIYRYYLNSWPHNDLTYGCDSISIPKNPADALIYTYPDTLYAPWYFITNGPLVLASRICLDCTLFGGSNKRPSFWQ